MVLLTKSNFLITNKLTGFGLKKEVSQMSNQYDVLSPWAEADPMPLKGISPRVINLTGKKIGLYATTKRAPKPILTVVEKKFKEIFPTSEISWYISTQHYSDLQIEGKNKAQFEEWVKGVDAVVTAVGD
jgi:hypothetical protein